MGEIEFRVWDKISQNWSKNTQHFLHCSVGNSLTVKPEQGDRYLFEQYTGLKDIKGVKIFEGDKVNVFAYYGEDNEHINDAIYSVSLAPMGIVLRYVELLWESGGHNQIPPNMTLSQEYGTLKTNHRESNESLMLPEIYGENHLSGRKWKGNSESIYFEVIGTIHEEE